MVYFEGDPIKPQQGSGEDRLEKKVHPLGTFCRFPRSKLEMLSDRMRGAI